MAVHIFAFGSHGTSAWAERSGPGVFDNVGGIPYTDVTGLRRGWGTTYTGKAGQAVYFHNPVTALESIESEDSTPLLTRLGARFELMGTARVTSVQVWNGENQIKTYDGLNIGPSPSAPIIFERQFAPGLGLPRRGIDVVVGVSFGTSSSDVTFFGAWAHYQVDVLW